MNAERRIENIPIDKIIPNIYQPRIKFDENTLNELASSIKEHGIIQPLILRKIGDTYEIIDGERRFRAAKKAGLNNIPSIILNITEQEAAELLLTENMQKQLLTPIEEANSYQQIMLLNKYDIDELAEKLKKDKNYIENKLNLLNLPLEIQEGLLNNKISEGHAKLLLKIESKAKKIEMYKKIIAERLTVKTLEELINNDVNSNINEIENDKISLNELNNEAFLKELKENKMEEQNMDNNQMNFNQFNNLLKEQQTQMMETPQPAPILGQQEKTTNEFFPSLEDQPLNMDIPGTEGELPSPTFDIPQFSQEPQMVNPNPAFEKPQAQPMPGPMEMPQFDIPQFSQEPQMVNPAPAFEMPQAQPMPGPMEMPQFDVPKFSQEPQMANPAPAFEMPQAQPMPGPMEMPQFDVPKFSQEPQMANPAPAFEMPQAQPMPGPMEMPQFDVSQFSQEPQMVNPNPAFEMPQTQPAVMVDVMPAVNMIRNLIPLLENSGYRINVEEFDNQGEYQITLKVQK